MDKHTIIGILLIVGIFIGFSIYNRPSAEDIAAQQRYRDSIAEVQIRQAQADKKVKDSLAKVSEFNIADADSATQAKYAEGFGCFAASALGNNNEVVIKNNKIKVVLESRGAKVSQVEIFDYKTFDGNPLLVMKKDDENELNLDFTCGSTLISTKNLYFQLQPSNGDDSKAVFRAYVNEKSWLEFAYSLTPDSYLLGFSVDFHNMDSFLNKSTAYSTFSWNQNLPILERGNKWEVQHSGLYYKADGDFAESLSIASESDEEKLEGDTRWIAYKGEFFSSVLIAKTSFNKPKVSFVNKPAPNIKFMKSEISLSTADMSKEMAFYFGPNKFSILKEVQLPGSTDKDPDLGLQQLVPLGWGIFGWVNRIAIIPLFNWLGSFISNYGLIIFIMTLIIKIVIFPLTYKSYKSTASMRVLKPQMDEINAKYPKQDDAMKKQQAIMELYRKAGVSPMGGCLPILLQMPILIAMFNFFPAAIELRQQSFLWAEDLSSYDSIITFPFEIPWYGDHVSLFTLLMAGAMIFSTKINSSQMDTGQSMPGMKIMMYMMPVMMLFWFNDYASGLTYYYLLSNIITIIQMIVIRRTLDEDAILAKIKAKVAKNSTKKKTGFMARLEEAQRRQMQMLQEQQKRKNNGK